MPGAVFATREISKDGGAFAATTNAPTEIGSSGMYTQALTAGEMTCDRYALRYAVTGHPDISVFGETATRQLGELAHPDSVIEGSLTLTHVLRIILAAVAGKSNSHAAGTPRYRNQADDKDRISATTDADGNRTAVTLDGT